MVDHPGEEAIGAGRQLSDSPLPSWYCCSEVKVSAGGSLLAGRFCCGLAMIALAACDANRSGPAEDVSGREARQPDEPSRQSEVDPTEGDRTQPRAVPPKEPEQTSVPPAPEQKASSDIGRLAELAIEADSGPELAEKAWGHLQAERYAEAQAGFALLTLEHPEPWKHPFNLACASALAADEDTARVALTEALRRDASAVEKRARQDPDLESIRDAAWFDPLMKSGLAGTLGELVKPPPAAPGGPAKADESDDEPEFVEPDEPKEPTGSSVPLSAAKLAELREALRAKHGLKTAVKSTHVVTPAEGERVAWAVYEFSAFDECLKTSTKKECRESLRGDSEEGEPDDSRCSKAWLVRSTLGPKITLDDPVAIGVPCTIGKVRALFDADLDGDGAPEVVVDVLGKREMTGFRESELSFGGRFVRILRLDGTAQYELDTSWTLTDLAPSDESSSRYGLLDANGDGHDDLEVQSISFTGMQGVEVDPVLWPSIDSLGELPSISVQIREYSPARDTWVARP